MAWGKDRPLSDSEWMMADDGDDDGESWFLVMQINQGKKDIRKHSHNTACVEENRRKRQKKMI